MPKIPQDLKDYHLQKDLEVVQSHTLGDKDAVVKVMEGHIVPMEFRAPAESLLTKDRPKLIEWSPNFLEYEVGKTTITKLAGGLISGPFSGCWFITFKWHDETFAAHVGTGDEDSAPTNEAKTGFLDWTYSNQIKGFKCFNPWDAYDKREKVELSNAHPNFQPFLIGYITRTQECYSIFLKRFKPETVKGGTWDIKVQPTSFQMQEKTYEVADVRICEEIKWSTVRHDFVDSMYKRAKQTLSSERKNEIKRFHYT